MRKFSASGREAAQELLEVQSVNGLRRDVKSQSTKRPNGTSPDHARAPTRFMWLEALAPIIYNSCAMGDVLAKIERMRDISGPILITGETGTGKELVARLIHAISPRHWRLNVFRVHIPPLRKRREDIRPLIKHFLARRQLETGKEGLQLSEEAWEAMLGHRWPGNVREVKNAMYRLVALAKSGEVIEREIALDAIRTGIYAPPPSAVVDDAGGLVIDPDQPLHEAMDKAQRFLIEHALNVTGGNRTQAAARLKVHRDGLGKMIDRLKIKVDRANRHT